MSVWTTKAQGRAKEYVVLKHNIPNANYIVGGIKFRGGYAVVEKGSKTHHNLLKIPVLKGAKEFPLTFLRKLPFISRTKDVDMVYGKDVFYRFIEAEEAEKLAQNTAQKVEEVEQHLASDTICKATTQTGSLCENELQPESPSGYCLTHLLTDPKLAEMGIEVPKFIPKEEKKKVRERVLRQLTEIRRSKAK
jgi:hypothetical protein